MKLFEYNNTAPTKNEKIIVTNLLVITSQNSKFKACCLHNIKASDFSHYNCKEGCCVWWTSGTYRTGVIRYQETDHSL